MLEPTRYKELCVDITTKRIKGGGYRVKGIAQHPVTGLCYEGIAPKYMTANSEAKIQETCRKVIYTLEQRYASTVLPPEKNALLSERVSAYLDTLLEKIDNAGVRIVPAWTAVGTNHSALVYFQNHVMDWLWPFLDGEKVYLPETDTAELKQLITEDSSASAKAVNDASVEKTVVRHLYDANCILSYLYRSGLGVPLITLVLDRSASVLPGNEMLKVVPADVFERFCGLLYEDSEAHPGQVLCAVIMVHGARTAEAAGTRLRDMTFEGAPFVFVYDYYAESKGRPQNRALRDEHGHVFGIIPGPFLVVGWTGKSHCSLASDWMEAFVDLFAVPEAFVMKGRELHIVPIYDNCSPGHFPN